jgi:hypothetical protein
LTLAALTLPRDFFVLILAAWIWLGFWTSVIPQGSPTNVKWEALVASLGEELASLLVAVPRRSRLERCRNGRTFVAGTVLAVGLIVLIYATNPYMWTL